MDEKINLEGADITFGGFIKSNLEMFLKKQARESGDPINWLYALEEALYKVTENFDWMEE